MTWATMAAIRSRTAWADTTSLCINSRCTKSLRITNRSTRNPRTCLPQSSRMLSRTNIYLPQSSLTTSHTLRLLSSSTSSRISTNSPCTTSLRTRPPQSNTLNRTLRRTLNLTLHRISIRQPLSSTCQPQSSLTSNRMLNHMSRHRPSSRSLHLDTTVKTSTTPRPLKPHTSPASVTIWKRPFHPTPRLLKSQRRMSNRISPHLPRSR